MPPQHPSQVRLRLCCCGALVEPHKGTTIPQLPLPQMGLAKIQFVCNECMQRLTKMIIDGIVRDGRHDSMRVDKFREFMIEAALPKLRIKEYWVSDKQEGGKNNE